MFSVDIMRMYIEINFRSIFKFFRQLTDSRCEMMTIIYKNNINGVYIYDRNFKIKLFSYH